MRKPKTPSRVKLVNPVARALRSGHLRPRVVPSKRTYKRHSRTPQGQSPNAQN
jgi:hypothetical protein